MRKYSKFIKDAIEAFLAKEDLFYDFNEEKGIFSFSSGVDCKLKKIIYKIIIRGTNYAVKTYSPIYGDEDDDKQITELCKFLTKVNYGKVAGYFSLDTNDGEIRYNYFVDCNGLSEIPEAIISRSIFVPCAELDEIGDALIGIIFGGKTADEAYAEIEDDNDICYSDIIDFVESTGIDIENSSAEEVIAQLDEILSDDDEDDEDDE